MAAGPRAFSTPTSAPKPASVTTKPDEPTNRRAITSAMTDELPVATAGITGWRGGRGAMESEREMKKREKTEGQHATVGERPRVHDGGRALQRLHQRRAGGVFHQHREGAAHAEVIRAHARAAPRRAHHHGAQPLPQIAQPRGHREGGHHLSKQTSNKGYRARGLPFFSPRMQPKCRTRWHGTSPSPPRLGQW